MRSSGTASVFCGALFASLLFAGFGTAAAQEGGGGPDARERESAAEAYDRGTSAYLARDYDRAAEWFETANRIAPAPAAILQAIRAHGRAGNTMRAASLAAQARELYPDDRTVARRTRPLLANEGSYLRARISCSEECSLEIDGSLEELRELFLAPDTPHRLSATFPHGTERREIQGGAGETVQVSFEAPAAPPEEELPATTEPSGEPAVQSSSSSLAVIPWWATIAAGGVTVALAATLIWSGVDTLGGVPAYERSPTPEGLADGQAREERTNWLIGATLLMGVATGAMAIFTDWSSLTGGGGAQDAEEEGEGEGSQAAAPSLRFSFGATPYGASAGVGGRF